MHKLLYIYILLFTWICTILASPNLSAAEAFSEQTLVDQVKQQVIKEILQSDWLSQQIEAGIDRYIRKLQKAQEAERIEQERQANEKVKQVHPFTPGRDHVRGNPTAEISLIEYSDFECPFCKQFHATALELLKASGGKVKWIYRHFPLPFHNPGAQQEAEASECAYELGGNEAFWAYTDAIYARTTSNGNGFQREKLLPLAEELGLNAIDFKSCLDGGRHASRVREDVDEGGRIGLTGTPANIIYKASTGEVRLVVGALPLSQVQKAIGELLDGTKFSGDNSNVGREEAAR